MSGLDVAAGVVSLASAGMAVAKGLIRIADGIGSAGEEVRMCAAETTMFSRMLQDLGEALKMPTAASGPTQNTAEDLIDICEEILEPFDRLIIRLTPLLEKYKNSEHQLRQVSLRIKWVFKHKSKVTFYQQALGGLKLTLICLLASINYREARSSAPQNIFHCHMEVLSSKASIDRLIGADKVKSIQTNSEIRTDHLLLMTGIDAQEQTERPDSGVEEQLQDFNIQVAHQGGLTAEDISNIEGDIDEDPGFDTTVAVHQHLLSLSRRVLRIAENILKPKNPSRPSESSSQPSSGPDLWSERKSAAGSSSLRAPSEPEDGPQTPIQGLERLITLQSPSGQKYALPYSLCSNWDGMKNTIKGMFGNDPSLRDNIASDFYALYLDNEAVVPIEHWESVVAPGMSFTLRILSVSFDNLNTKNNADGPPAANGSAPSNSVLPISLLTMEGYSTHSTEERLSAMGPIIRLKDSRDIYYAVPFQACRTHEDFDALLCQIYGIEENGNSPYQDTRYNQRLKPYTVWRDDDTRRVRIPEHLWENVMEPGWTIHISFDDKTLNLPPALRTAVYNVAKLFKRKRR